jgi:adenylate cyclase
MSWQNYLRRHSEFVIVVGSLLVIAAVFHWIPFKIAFLSFFYLPVLAAGYLMGTRRAMLTGLMCVLLVITYYLWEWTRLSVVSGPGLTMLMTEVIQHWDILLNIAMWGGFLILTGGAFGHFQEKLATSWEHARDLNEKLETQAQDLLQVNEALQSNTTKLEQQAEALQEKNLQIEELRQKVEQTLYSAMDSTVARLLIQGRLREQKSHISILFCDLKGFSNYTQTRNPEVVLEDLNHFYEVMEKQIEGYCGHIDKYLGDGIMCEFGAPVDYEQHSLQAVVAALVMQKKFREEGFPWTLRIGISSGESIVGMMGSRRRSYSAIGEVVNLAKRLEELCEPGHVYMDEATCRAVQSVVELEQVRGQGGRRAEDKPYVDEITEKQQLLKRDPENADLMFEIGKLYFQIREANRALNYFRLAMELKPDDDAIKVAYAEASIKREDYEKISIRGLDQKQRVFKALRVVNPLSDRSRFPEGFYSRYGHVEGMVEIPGDVTLPVEVLDGTVGHSLVVAVVAYALADQLGLSEELKRAVLVAGRIQDLGKSAVWHHLLNRRGGLSDQERKELERHVEESVLIAKRMGYSQPAVLDMIAGHHELLSGEGYPRHAKGDDISLGARICCIADVYCALTELRPYRNSWDTHVALNELQKGVAAGKYDPKVVDALLRLMS